MKECSLSWYQELVLKKVFVLNLFLGSFLKIPSPDNAMLVKISFLDHRDGFFLGTHGFFKVLASLVLQTEAINCPEKYIPLGPE